MGAVRKTLQLGSQDLGIKDLAVFRERVVSSSGLGGGFSELIVLSGISGTTQFGSFEEMGERMEHLPTEPTYLYYTIIYPSKARCSLYLDPDMPARIVMEGDIEWSSKVERGLKDLFDLGDKRYKVHNPIGFIFIWASVICIATLFIAGYVMGSGSRDPMVIIPVIISAGLLGTYLSLAKVKDLQPANTISLAKRRRWWLESLLHLLTIALGIISAIIASVLISMVLN